jgi:hypothetical protein
VAWLENANTQRHWAWLFVRRADDTGHIPSPITAGFFPLTFFLLTDLRLLRIVCSRGV